MTSLLTGTPAPGAPGRSVPPDGELVPRSRTWVLRSGDSGRAPGGEFARGAGLSGECMRLTRNQVRTEPPPLAPPPCPSGRRVSPARSRPGSTAANRDRTARRSAQSRAVATKRGTQREPEPPAQTARFGPAEPSRAEPSSAGR